MSPETARTARIGQINAGHLRNLNLTSGGCPPVE